MTDEALAVSWGRNVLKARLALSATQKQVAERCGVAQNTISRIETGTSRPDDPLKFRLAEVLGEPVEDLFPLRPHGSSEVPVKRRASGLPSPEEVRAFVTASRAAQGLPPQLDPSESAWFRSVLSPYRTKKAKGA